MYINWYYLHFPVPVTADDIAEAFVEYEDGVKVTDIFPGGYELFTPLSYSKVKYALGQRFTAAYFYVCKVRDGAIHEPD